MAAIVVDASAMIELLTGAEPSRKLRQRVRMNTPHAPEVLVVEVLNVLRRQMRAGSVTESQGERAVSWLAQAPIALSQHRPLIHRVWQLRHAIRAYDASYVALAERLDAPLVTTDDKLTNSNGHIAKIESYPTS